MLVAFHVAWHELGRADAPSSVLWTLMAFYYGLMMIFAITCHRQVLLRERRGEAAWFPSFTWREARFAGWMLAAWAVYFAVQLPVAWMISLVLANLGMIDHPIIMEVAAVWSGGFAGVYALARIALVFPATAIGQPTGMLRSWSDTDGNGWRMLVIVGALPLVIGHATDWLYSRAAGVVTVTAASLLIAVFLVFEVAALSLSYEDLSVPGEGRPA